jgi:hypothetical protein
MVEGGRSAQIFGHYFFAGTATFCPRAVPMRDAGFWAVAPRGKPVIRLPARILSARDKGE